MVNAGSLGVLYCQLALEVLISPYSWMIFFLCGHVQVLSCQVVGVFRHLGFEVCVVSSEVIHCCPVIRCRLGEVGKFLLYPGQVVVSVATLEQCLLSLSDIELGFNEVGLEGRQYFFPKSSMPENLQGNVLFP